MGTHKLILELAPGKALGAFALGAMLACRELAEVVAVVRPEDDLAWAAPALTHKARAKLRFAVCADADRGMAHSLRRGLAEALAGRPDAVLVALADQPFVTAELLGELAAAFGRDRSLDYVACRRGGSAHPPVLLGAAIFPAVERLEGDAGARKLFAEASWNGKLVDVPSDRVFADADTPDDLRALRRMTGAGG